jgi:hypothetical protein
MGTRVDNSAAAASSKLIQERKEDSSLRLEVRDTRGPRSRPVLKLKNHGRRPVAESRH